jgi:hypothetical protein
MDVSKQANRATLSDMVRHAVIFSNSAGEFCCAAAPEADVIVNKAAAIFTNFIFGLLESALLQFCCICATLVRKMAYYCLFSFTRAYHHCMDAHP